MSACEKAAEWAPALRPDFLNLRWWKDVYSVCLENELYNIHFLDPACSVLVTLTNIVENREQGA